MMGDCTSGELLFSWVCLMLLSSVESLNWTVQPANPTVMVKGQDVSLTWRYTLTAEEQTKSQSSFLVKWQKLNHSNSLFDDVASYLKISLVNNPFFDEQAPRIVVDRATGTDFASLKINDVVISDEGIYKILISAGGVGNSIDTDEELNLTVLVPPEIDHVSSFQDICEGSLVTLSCNATGRPTPNINWTRVADNGTDSAPLPAVDGTYIINNITRRSDGTYRCTAYNGLAGTVNHTVLVSVGYPPSVDRIINSSNTVIEGDPFNMTCEASGDPIPKNVTWISVDTGQRHYGSILAFSNINRSDAGEYRCEADNRCGKDSRVQFIDVLYKPSDVTLETNTTENNNNYCSEPMWGNFTCVGSKANPGIESYQLYKNRTLWRSGNSGTWTEKISIGGYYLFSCLAVHAVKNVSSPDVIVTLNVLSQIYVNVTSGNETLEEGENVSLYCNVSGFPKPTITWSEVGVHEPVERGHWLNLTDTTRNEAGNYSCQASNTCGEKNSSTISIDVQYQPENVSLDVNISGKVCVGVMVKFTCTANANPAVNSYTLYENDVMIENMGTSGVIRRPLNTSGQVVYRCEAKNSVGTDRSSDKNLTVEVPASVTSISYTADIKEGDNVIVLCQVFGDPTPDVFWASNHLNKSGDTLTFPNITRNYTGNYTCIASNACDSDSETTFLNVQYSPSAISSGLTKRVELGKSFSYPCPVDGKPQPTITWYSGREPSLPPLLHGENLELPVPESRDSGWYTCFASNSLGNATATVELIVVNFSDVRLSLEVENKSCNVSNDLAHVKQDLPKLVFQAYDKEGLESVNIDDTACGSIIVDLVLRFSQSVNESDVISTLRTAAVAGKFSPFTVNPESIRITFPEPSPQSTKTTKGTEPSTKGPSCEKSFIENEHCKIIWWKVIVIIVAIVLLIVLVIAVVACFIHKKRKCRKDPRTMNARKICEDNPYSHVNSGYAHSGPPSANGTDGGGQQQAAAAAPTYAVVDKSKKTKKKKDEKEDCTYAQVDMSKKTSKKQQPRNADGLLYADLGDFERPQMPPVSTSPETLPPVKKPPAYEATQYADVTEFLKGDATLPKEGDSQGMEMQPQAAPPANGNSQGNEVKPQGDPPANGNNQGNEVKPQGANKGESGVPPKESKL